MNRINICSGAKWEDIVGYSRAVKVGNTVEVAGTTAVINGKVVGPDNVYDQACCIFEKIETALQQAGARLSHVVRTTAYVTDITRWEEYAKAHSQFFDTIRPVATLVEVSALVDPDLLVEVEVTAVIHDT
jgi:enamine deaminase RidA (YjgF/YER057c/UK114 family)